MSEEKIKFEVMCYLQGYGYWKVVVYDGDWNAGDKIYTVSVKKGLYDGNEISGKTFRFPVESTVIEENK